MYTKNYKNKKTAFTLAETLVVLAIVGTIAALTIPGLVQGTLNKEHISSAKKSYAVISRATEMVQNKLGPISQWDKFATADQVWNAYVEQLNITKNCSNTAGCFPAVGYRRLNGESLIEDNISLSVTYYTAALADGSLIAIWPFNNAISADYGLSPEQVIYGVVLVDTNGLHGPNVYGKDVFRFALTQDGALPSGSADSSDCLKGSAGLNCAAKVIVEDKMTY